MSSGALETMPGRGRRSAGLGAGLIGAAVVIAVGFIGVYRYLDNFWLYRGFSAPQDPAFVHHKGSVERIYVRSPALGGRSQPVDIYLPPGYASSPRRRYPAFYLLHGVPGRPGAFLQTVRLGVVEDVLLARHKIKPMILVMPFGSTGSFTDKEWANGIQPHEGWETFLSRDVVAAVDRRYRTVPAGAGRALGGLSEGGYGALNIALHHPGRFHVIESWSGYQRADDLRPIFGHRAALLDWNSPSWLVSGRAPTLRAQHTFVWFYSANGDRLLGQNVAFARKLARLGIASRFAVLRGGHDWSLWRAQAANALLAASKHLGSPRA